MKRLLLGLMLVTAPVLAPVELADSAWSVSAPDPAICLLFGISAGGLALALWRRRSPR